ncbi:MAG: transglutaminase [Hyphomicrobiales bacterium]|nr:transglutaminase [Hyphomicrobiales bacterium]
MRIHIRHEIVQTFTPPAKGLNAIMRLTPRSHEGQHVIDWRVEIDADCRLRNSDDSFGNLTQAISLAGPTGQLRIAAEGVVETFDAAGIVRNSAERFPPELFLRETLLTTPDAALRAFASDVEGSDAIERLHALLVRVSERFEVPEDAKPTKHAAGAGPGAAHAFAASAGSAHDLAHVFVACARLMGAPARVVSGHYVSEDEASAACHAWAEAHVEGVGWIGFDPLLGICPHESHVRIACGLDALDAAPLRTAGASAVVDTTSILVRMADRQMQGQRQQ